MNQQLKALYKTKKMLEREWRNDSDYHIFLEDTCPLCKSFDSNCTNCPFALLEDRGKSGCVAFAVNLGENEKYYSKAPIDETLSIILSMIQYYEEQ